MRIQSISTNNNLYNTNFQKLKLDNPHKWDVDVMKAVVDNQSVKDLTKQLAEKGKDVELSAALKPLPILMKNGTLLYPVFIKNKSFLMV